MTTLSQYPTYPVPGRPAKLRFALTNATANYVRVWLTDAPQGSKHRSKIDSGSTRDKVYEGAGGANAELRFEPDKGGNYIFAAQEYVKGATSHGGSYQDDPDTYQSEDKVGAETTLTLEVGVRVTQTMGTAADTATMVLYVFGDTIRATTLEVHGETTPAVIEPTSQAARVASLDTDVVAQLAAIDGSTGTVALGDPSTVIDDLIDQLNAHRTQATVHNTNDTDNTIDASFTDPSGPKGVVESANEFLTKLRLHMRNANSDDSSIGSQAYHAPGATKKADLANLTLIESAGDKFQAVAAIADGWRAYEAHRASTAAHDNADTTNTAATLPRVFRAHRYFMNSLRQNAPTAPATESSGAITLVQSGGFRETPL